MLKSFYRPALIFLAFTAGFLMPGAICLQGLIRYILMAMLFIVFLQVQFSNLKPKRTHWRILAANLLMGILCWLAMLLTSSDTLAKTAFFTGIIPTASAAPVVMKFLGGNTGFMITAFLITNVGVACALTGLIPIVTGNLTFAFLIRVLLSLLFVIGIPMTVAVLLRKIKPAIREKAGKLSGLSFMMWIAMLFITAASASHFLHSHPELSSVILLKIAILSAGICILNFTIGFLIAEKRYRREASQALGQKNTMLLLYITLTFAGPLPALGPTFYVVWHNIWNAIQMYLHDRKQLLRKKKPISICHSGKTDYISEKNKMDNG